jgi:hypothetical protein
MIQEPEVEEGGLNWKSKFEYVTISVTSIIVKIADIANEEKKWW